MTHDDAAVGYGRPPRHSQFKPGQSGNPKGRPRGARGATSLIAKTLGERIAVRENGRTRKISKLEASLTQLANKAAGGDIRAILAVVALARGTEARASLTDAPVLPLNDADRRVLDQLMARVRDQASAAGNASADLKQALSGGCPDA